MTFRWDTETERCLAREAESALLIQRYRDAGLRLLRNRLAEEPEEEPEGGEGAKEEGYGEGYGMASSAAYLLPVAVHAES